MPPAQPKPQTVPAAAAPAAAPDRPSEPTGPTGPAGGGDTLPEADFSDRAVPAKAIDPRAFRDAMGRFVTGVCVATTLDPEDKPVGVTVNSFTSVSLDPPLVLFCLEKTARTRPAFEAAGRFAVNVLGEAHRDLSTRFAKAPTDWTGVAAATAATGVPVLTEALTVLDCRTEAIHEGGDHLILVGRVVRLISDPGETRPLVYHRGGYAQLAGDAGDG
jgi:flavin reductase (DIM6/NTAB) family NADH-FMN oxidoreductase RutF